MFKTIQDDVFKWEDLVNILIILIT